MSMGRHVIALAALLAPAGTLSAGCIDALADYYTPLTDPKLATWNDGGGDGSNPACAGDPSNVNVTADCGVFAQADAPAGGDGSMARPFAKLGDAITKAASAGKRVYACTSAPFGEAVTISAGIEVYGGLDCTKGWAWAQDKRS